MGSDLLISFFEGRVSHFLLEGVRMANNFLLFGITALLLYRQIRKQQHHLKTSEAQYRRLFESNPNPMWVFHTETFAFIAVNDAAIDKYGYSQEEFLARTIWDIRPVEDHKLLKENLKLSSQEARDAGIWRHIKKSGEVFPVTVVSHDVFFNRLSCKMVMATDMTAIVQHEEKLKEAYRKEKALNNELAENYERIEKAEREGRLMAQVMDKINNLVLITGADDRITWSNKAFSRFTGFAAEEAVGKNPGELLSGHGTDAQTVIQLRQAIQDRNFFEEEMISYKKNGDAYWTQLSISPIFDETGAFSFFVSVESVITERKEREQKILAQHAILQEIAWTNSHELRRPVGNLLGLIGILQDTNSDQERQECLEMLARCSQELDQIIRDTNQKTQRMELKVG